MGVKDYESTKKRLIELGYLDARYIHPDEIFTAVDKALDHAVVGRATIESPSPRSVAEYFLRETVESVGTPLSDRMHAAALLLQVKP